jgi:hypothetical protein
MNISIFYRPDPECFSWCKGEVEKISTNIMTTYDIALMFAVFINFIGFIWINNRDYLVRFLWSLDYTDITDNKHRLIEIISNFLDNLFVLSYLIIIGIFILKIF